MVEEIRIADDWYLGPPRLRLASNVLSSKDSSNVCRVGSRNVDHRPGIAGWYERGDHRASEQTQRRAADNDAAIRRNSEHRYLRISAIEKRQRSHKYRAESPVSRR